MRSEQRGEEERERGRKRRGEGDACGWGSTEQPPPPIASSSPRQPATPSELPKPSRLSLSNSTHTSLPTLPPIIHRSHVALRTITARGVGGQPTNGTDAADTATSSSRPPPITADSDGDLGRHARQWRLQWQSHQRRRHAGWIRRDELEQSWSERRPSQCVERAGSLSAAAVA